jgi:hypothetical protein
MIADISHRESVLILYLFICANLCKIGFFQKPPEKDVTGELNIPKTIYLFNEGTERFDFKKIKNFIKENFGGIKVNLIQLKNKIVATKGILVDFISTQKEFNQLEYAKEKDSCNIILTDRLFATLDKDNRLHIRAGIYGYPSVISTSGIVEGPAKPKDYYIYKQRYTHLDIWDLQEAKIKKKFKDKFIDYDDKRLSDVLKGYISQALFFYITGEPFCEQKYCRLFNSHWQEELIYSQIKIGKFCKTHQRLLQKIKSGVKKY